MPSPRFPLAKWDLRRRNESCEECPSRRAIQMRRALRHRESRPAISRMLRLRTGQPAEVEIRDVDPAGVAIAFAEDNLVLSAFDS